MNNKVYVGNLPFKTTEEQVRNMFQQMGEITELFFARDKYSNEFKGFAFVTYATDEAAQAALSMDGKDFEGRPLKVSIARERTQGDDRGRRGGNGGGGARRHW